MDTVDLQGVAESLRSLAQQLGPLTQLENGPLWLALDQGGHASRAIVFDSAGQQVAQAFAPIITHQLDNERIEHEPLDIVQSLRLVIDDVVQALGADVDRVQAAGLATQRSSIVCWHAQSGAPLSPVLSWQDRRNASLITQLQQHQTEVQDITGLVLSPHYGASKLRWCLDHLPAVQAAREQGQLHMGPLSSYLLYELLVEHPHVVDPANASRTLLWSPATGKWSEQLLQWFGIPIECLPQPMATLHDYGQLQLGTRVVPLIACTGDQAAVPFANGPLDEHCAYVNMGTGAFALAPITQDTTQAAPLLRSVLYSTPDAITFALEGTVNGAASALHWLAERSGLDVQRAALALHQDQLTNRNVPIFINGIGGIGSPYWLAQVQSQFLSGGDGESDTTDETAQLAAVVESIAFLLNANLQLMRQQLPTLNKLIVGGGLATCSYLCQCLADLTELPLTRLGERELTAKGVAYLIADHPPHWPQDIDSKLFHPQHYTALQMRQQRWLKQMAALQHA